jgi:HK97 family phage major capsid protein
MSYLKALRDKKAALVKQGNELIAKSVDNADGLLTAEQDTEHKQILATIERVNGQIASAEQQAEAERTLTPAASITNGNKDDKGKIAAGNIHVGDDLAGTKPFSSIAEQLLAIREAGTQGGTLDPRLRTGAVAGASEKVASDGGFLIQTDFSSELLKRAYSIGDISSRVRRVPISAGSNGLKINAVKESSRANGSRWGGVTMAWEGEGDSPTASKPKFRQMELKLNKLIGLMYATDELLGDATALSSIAMEAFSEELNFNVESAILEGTGAGMPKGLWGSAAEVAVAKEVGQAADTILYENVIKMWARMWGRSRKNAVWLINQDIEPALFTMSLAVGTGGVPVYQPANGAADQPYSTLMGRPVIPVEHASTLGDLHDISLVDLSQYLMIDKGAPEQAASIHVRFIYDETAFRITYRCDGQPIWETALTPKKGTNTLSPFITLAAR